MKNYMMRMRGKREEPAEPLLFADTINETICNIVFHAYDNGEIEVFCGLSVYGPYTIAWIHPPAPADPIHGNGLMKITADARVGDKWDFVYDPGENSTMAITEEAKKWVVRNFNEFLSCVSSPKALRAIADANS